MSTFVTLTILIAAAVIAYILPDTFEKVVGTITGYIGLGILAVLDVLQAIVLTFVWMIVVLADKLWTCLNMLGTLLYYVFWAGLLLYFSPIILIVILVMTVA